MQVALTTQRIRTRTQPRNRTKIRRSKADQAAEAEQSSAGGTQHVRKQAGMLIPASCVSMTQSNPPSVRDSFPQTWSRLPAQIKSECLEESIPPETFPERLLASAKKIPGYLPDLAGLERALHAAEQNPGPGSSSGGRLTINPGLQLLQVAWSGLPELLRGEDVADTLQQEEATLLVWRKPGSAETQVRKASQRDLLALKIAAEGLDPLEVAREHGRSCFAILALLREARSDGLVQGPISAIQSDLPNVGTSADGTEKHTEVAIFTLQWHLTQACDLHCRHCYDRSKRSSLPLDKAVAALEDFVDFCTRHRVQAQISFSGGNPLLYPDFFLLYEAAATAGCITAILGNPCERAVLERLAAIQRPAFYQVSLEGLAPQDDWMRQPGHFQRTLDFLTLLQDLDIPSRVMLTLTESNLNQVLPLADVLRDRTDRFTFNRLSLVGEGAGLRLPAPGTYHAFLRDYLAAAASNPVLGLKDNLLNAVLFEQGRPLFGGCTGYGCGAAFNFLALLPDGELHACRKFPSSLGNVFEDGFDACYESPQAKAYRRGPAECESCPVQSVCRGCLAIISSLGLDVGTDRDPFCPLKNP